MNYAEVIKRIKGSIAFIAVLDSQNKPMGTGSGFIFWKKGILVTCNHVVKGASVIFIKFNGGEFRSAKVVVKDEEHDLALLKFEGEEESLIISEIKDVQEGTEVLFAGYPLSLQDLTTHQGIISAITKDLSGITTYLIDGTVNAGNSGCPLLDLDGKVLGVVNAKRMEQGNLLSKVENMKNGAVALHGVDLVDIYGAIISNLQLGIGYAIPAKYIPDHKEIVDTKQNDTKQNE
ncbi:trypsin-like peptidase domain-containing protein [Candidatus Wolfebacteria bacterium]|nr:trypsin-like peptidase domain-containing protein [Candidatus Wolfebacteria bacterium]